MSAIGSVMVMSGASFSAGFPVRGPAPLVRSCWVPSRQPQRSRGARGAEPVVGPGGRAPGRGGSPSLRGGVGAPSTSPRTEHRRPTSPRGLRDARQLALVRHVAQADPAQPELAVHRLGPPAPLAAGVGAYGEPRLAGLLHLERCLSQRVLLSSG